MKLISNRIRGMQDLLPPHGEQLDKLKQIFKEEAYSYGFKLIRTPVLEQTKLFERSVGDASDIVQKEMYTFEDKGGREVSLRPEGTAGILRAVLENGLHNNVLPLKLMSFVSCYRYEKPQSGRLREFFQFDAEIFGSSSPEADAELISMAKSILDRIQLENIELQINSIGCTECRKKYSEAIRNYFSDNIDNLCQTCKERLSKNPMRILDCKNADCKNICENAPIILDYVCDDCKNYFEKLKILLSEYGIDYVVNPKIVRGLDYYCKTVFEFVYKNKDSELTVCGGGRYDGLADIVAGVHLPAIGFGIGMERIMMILEEQNIDLNCNKNPEIFIASVDEDSRKLAIKICDSLRKSSICAQIDISEKNLKSQIKYADKINAKFLLVIGDDEVKTGKGIIKNMSTGEKYNVNINNNLIRDFIELQKFE